VLGKGQNDEEDESGMDVEVAEEAKLLQCRDCLVYVHERCYGAQDYDGDPKDWRCDRCTKYKGEQKLVRCLLCPNLGGAFKLCEEEEAGTSKDRWVHAQCATWIPEVDFKSPATMSEVTGLEMIGRDRWDLTCSICRKKKKNNARGACIQCSKGTCATAFHVTCAQQAGLHLRQAAPLEAAEAFCGTHDPVKGGMASGGIEEGQEVCWGARGFMEGKVIAPYRDTQPTSVTTAAPPLCPLLTLSGPHRAITSTPQKV